MVDRLKHDFFGKHVCILNVFRGSVTPEIGALVNGRPLKLDYF